MVDSMPCNILKLCSAYLDSKPNLDSLKRFMAIIEFEAGRTLSETSMVLLTSSASSVDVK